jgi:hypothetical protein
MYYANSLFGQGLNSVIDVFKQEAAKQKEENTYEAVANLKQAAQDGVNRNEQVQAAYSDPGIATFDAADAANLRASQASTAPTQLSAMLNQYTANRDATPIDLKLLNSSYDSINNDMQGRFDHREDVSMKLHDAATKEDQWHQDYAAGRTDAANAQKLEEQKLKYEQARLAGEASERKQRMDYAAEARRQNTALFNANVLNDNIAVNADQVGKRTVTDQNFQDNAAWDREFNSVDAANKAAYESGSAVTVPNLDGVDKSIPASTIQQAIAYPDKVRDLATSLGMNVNDFQSVVDASKARAGQAKAAYTQQELARIQDPLIRTLVANKQLPNTAYIAPTPTDATTAANNSKAQATDIRSTVLAKIDAVSPGASQVIGFKYDNKTNTMVPAIDDEAFSAVYNIKDVNSPEAKAIKATLEQAANTVLKDRKTNEALVSTTTADTPSEFARKINEEAAAKNAARNAANRTADIELKAQQRNDATPEVMSRLTEGLNTDDTARGLGSALKTTAEAFRNSGLNSVANEHFMRTLRDTAVTNGVTKDSLLLDNTSSDYVKKALLPTLVSQGIITQLEASKLASEFVHNNPISDKRDLKSGGGTASDDELQAALQGIIALKNGTPSVTSPGQTTINNANTFATRFGSRPHQ